MSVPPKAPPVYRPSAPRIAVPPVYRPNQGSSPSVQQKPVNNFRLETRPAPPPYRPQPIGLQAHSAQTGNRALPAVAIQPTASVSHNAFNPKPNARRPVFPPQAAINLPKPTCGSAGTAHNPRPIAQLQPARATLKSNAVQRELLEQTGFVKNKDLAEDFLNKKTSLGYTPPHINNLIVREDTTAHEVANAIKEPTITTNKIKDGEYEATVAQPPKNYVGYRMYLPIFGPWIAEATNISDALARAGIREDRLQFQIDRLEVEITGHDGKHETLSAEVEKHEKVHAEDILRLKQQYFAPWDKRLTEAKEKGMRFSGATEEEAVNKLYQYAGGTAKEVAVAFFKATEEASRAFHKTPRGKTESFPPSFERSRGVNGYRVIVKWRHPV